MENQVRTYEEAVEITVKWWSKKSFETPLNQNNGDTSSMGGRAFMLMNVLSQKSQQAITGEQKQIFEEKLTEILMGFKERNRYQTTLSVDYDPNIHLFEACQVAGINTNCLPIKSFTRIQEDNSVEGRYQYGGEFFKI